VRDAAGTPTTEWAEVVPQNAFANEILFCGYRLDTYSGVYDVRNRMYHPTLGRWLQRDLVGMSPIWDLPYRLGRGIGKAIYDTFVLPPPPEGRGRGRCGLNIDEVFLAMLMRLQGRVNQLRDADRSPWYLADCLFSDAWWFMYGNGNSMDFDIDGRAGCPSGEGCERTVTLCGRCIHNSQVNDMVYGFMARAVGMSEIGAAKWANGLELKTKGKVETPIQRASYILGADLGKWVSTPSEPLTVESMCWQMTQGSLLDSATAGGAYDHCELCQECARPEDVGKDFSTTNWDSNKGPDYTYFGSPSASQPTTGP